MYTGTLLHREAVRNLHKNTRKTSKHPFHMTAKFPIIRSTLDYFDRFYHTAGVNKACTPFQKVKKRGRCAGSRQTIQPLLESQCNDRTQV